MRCAARLGVQRRAGLRHDRSQPGHPLHAPIEPPGKRKPGSIGVVIPNTECKIVDVATRAELGVNQDGELWVRGRRS